MIYIIIFIVVLIVFALMFIIRVLVLMRKRRLYLVPEGVKANMLDIIEFETRFAVSEHLKPEHDQQDREDIIRANFLDRAAELGEEMLDTGVIEIKLDGQPDETFREQGFVLRARAYKKHDHFKLTHKF